MDNSLTGLDLKDFLAGAVRLFMPQVCVCCGAVSDGPVCPKCLEDFPFTRYQQCDFNPLADKYNEKLSRWLTSYEPYAHAASMFFYAPVCGGGDLTMERGYAAITRELKYHRGFRLGAQMGSMLGALLKSEDAYADVDTVVPVPLHWTRLAVRGYNQAEVIARAVARAMGAACRPELLTRRRRTSTQTALDIEEKQTNVQGAFRAHESESSPGHILIVDDVATTCSTLSECHRALRELYPYPIRISAATLASVV